MGVIASWNISRVGIHSHLWLSICFFAVSVWKLISAWEMFYRCDYEAHWSNPLSTHLILIFYEPSVIGGRRWMLSKGGFCVCLKWWWLEEGRGWQMAGWWWWWWCRVWGGWAVIKKFAPGTSERPTGSRWLSEKHRSFQGPFEESLSHKSDQILLPVRLLQSNLLPPSLKHWWIIISDVFHMTQ